MFINFKVIKMVKNKMCTKTIGIVGGMGPKTGIDLANKIIKNTLADSDQEHIPLLLISYPHTIKDRTEFLQGKHHENPAFAIYQLIRQLESWGANIIGIPCNTSHAPQIMDVISEQLTANKSKVILVNLIETVAEFIIKHFPTSKNIGLLATLGSYENGIYPAVFSQFGLEIINPDDLIKQAIHQAIYDTQYGIKSTLSLNLDKAKSILTHACEHLADLGANVVVSGCTEIPLVLSENSYNGIALIDPSEILARRLIELADGKKLKPYL
jgi:aspartate racemase